MKYLQSINQSDVMPKIDYRKIKEYTGLAWLHLKVKLSQFSDYLKVLFLYYPNFSFFKADVGIILTYLFDNPFTISKRFLMREGEDDLYQYGETPLTTLATIMQECGVTKTDTIFELGSGRGRTCFWMSEVLGAQTVGIEHIPEFVQRANRIKRKVGVTKASFRQENMLESDLTGATTIYLYGTCYQDDFIEKLAEKLSQLPSGTKIITVSYPLTDYTKANTFEVMKRFPARFTWGTGDVYLHVIR